MNLPNKITMARFLLIPVFVVLYITMDSSSPLPLIVFALASFTDFLDGAIARKYRLVTTFGKFMDPLVDKILTIAAFVLLVQSGDISGWIVIIIIARELVITGFRTIAASNGVTIAASSWGKFKTNAQMFTILYFLAEDNLLAKVKMPWLETGLLYLALALTIISGLDYIIRNLHVLDLENI